MRTADFVPVATRSFEESISTLFLADPSTAQDIEQIAQTLRNDPWIGLRHSSGYFVLQHGKIRVLYDVASDDKLVRLVAVKRASERSQED